MSDPLVFIVTPRSDGGCDLSGPLLPFCLKYEDEAEAVNYAHHVARITGAIVLAINRRGDVELWERSYPLTHAEKTW